MEYFFILVSFLCVILAILSLFIPKKIVPGKVEKRTRVTGLFFWLFASFIAFDWFIVFIPNIDGVLGIFIITVFFSFILLVWIRRLYCVNQEKVKKITNDKINNETTDGDNHTLKNSIDNVRLTNKITVSSYTEEGISYEIDTLNLTCTCPDWEKRRSHVSKDSPARLCKHLVEYFSRKHVEIPQELKLYKDIIIFQGRRLRGMSVEKDDMHVLYDTAGGIGFMADFMEDSDWINVVIDGNRYGYNYAEERWSYGKAPRYAEIIIPKIERLVFS